MHTALLHPISQAFRHWVGLGFRDSVKFCLQAFEKFVFGIEARRAAGTWCRKFDPVRIGRGGDHISEGIQLGGEVTSLLQICTLLQFFLFCLGRFWLSFVHVHAEVSDVMFAV